MRRRGSARRHDLRTPTGSRRRVGRLRAKEVRGTSAARPDDRPHASRSFGRIAAVGRLCRSKAMDCLVEALTGNVRQARLMKNTPTLRGAFRLPFALAHGPSVPHFGAAPLAGGPFLPFFKTRIGINPNPSPGPPNGDHYNYDLRSAGHPFPGSMAVE